MQKVWQMKSWKFSTYLNCCYMLSGAARDVKPAQNRTRMLATRADAGHGTESAACHGRWTPEQALLGPERAWLHDRGINWSN